MERFTRHADRGTGVVPFAPVTQPANRRASRIPLLGLAALLSLLRTILACAVLLLIAAFEVVTAPLVCAALPVRV